MSFIQKLVTGILPKRWAESIKAESESWLLHCPTCGSIRSIWDIGGIRYKAASHGKRTMVWCQQCGKLRMMAVEQEQIDSKSGDKA
jgi:uncharacterized Zn finger protein